MRVFPRAAARHRPRRGASGRADPELRGSPTRALDPIARNPLRIGVFRLAERHEIPYRVVVNGPSSSVTSSAQRTDWFVNAVLDARRAPAGGGR
jgi:transcription termination factor NusB